MHIHSCTYILTLGTYNCIHVHAWIQKQTHLRYKQCVISNHTEHDVEDRPPKSLHIFNDLKQDIINISHL